MSEPLDLEPIKARLAAAPRAPWVGERVPKTDDLWRFWFGHVRDRGTADLIANSPTDLAALIAELERLRDLVVEMAEWAVDGAVEYGREDLADKFRAHVPDEL